MFDYTTWCELADYGQKFDLSADAVTCNLSIVVDGHSTGIGFTSQREEALDAIFPKTALRRIDPPRDVRLSRQMPIKFPGVNRVMPNFEVWANKISIPLGAGA